jgi:hypothetical protein
MRGKCYVGETGKSMKAVELAASEKDCWRKIAISLIDKFHGPAGFEMRAR